MSSNRCVTVLAVMLLLSRLVLISVPPTLLSLSSTACFGYPSLCSSVCLFLTDIWSQMYRRNPNTKQQWLKRPLTRNSMRYGFVWWTGMEYDTLISLACHASHKTFEGHWALLWVLMRCLVQYFHFLSSASLLTSNSHDSFSQITIPYIPHFRHYPVSLGHPIFLSFLLPCCLTLSLSCGWRTIRQ